MHFKTGTLKYGLYSLLEWESLVAQSAVLKYQIKIVHKETLALTNSLWLPIVPIELILLKLNYFDFSKDQKVKIVKQNM